MMNKLFNVLIGTRTNFWCTSVRLEVSIQQRNNSGSPDMKFFVVEIENSDYDNNISHTLNPFWETFNRLTFTLSPFMCIILHCIHDQFRFQILLYCSWSFDPYVISCLNLSLFIIVVTTQLCDLKICTKMRSVWNYKS